MKYQMLYRSNHQEYTELIKRFVSNTNPIFHADAKSVSESIMTALIASRNVRLGPAPNIQSHAIMLDIVEKYVDENLAIPILIPAGPKKTQQGESIDMAEYSMLNILNCLNNAVRKHYDPGLDIRIRLEDLTGTVMEPDYFDDMQRYINDFTQLIKVLEYNFIEPWAESNVGKEKSNQFFNHARIYTKLMYDYIMESYQTPEEEWIDLESYKDLAEHGWIGMISLNQRQLYIDKYSRLYPELNRLQKIELMCKYFASSLARKIVGMTGKKNAWMFDNPLEIGYMSPVPEYQHPRRLYYRSIDLKNSKKSIPFWRAKGFLKIKENNKIRLSSMTWIDAKSVDFFEGRLLLKNGNDEVSVKCDYLLVD